MRIQCAEDFGVGINCMTRLYMRRYDENVLDQIVEVVDEYIKYLSSRTIICSLRDFVDEPRIYGNDVPIPENQQKRVDHIIKILVQQGLTLDKVKNKHYSEDERIYNFGRDIYFCNHHNGNSKYNRESFLEWVYKNHLNEEVVYKEISWKDEASLPLKKKKLHLLLSVCRAMFDYSYGRHTYMPSTCRMFIKKNWVILSTDFLEEIHQKLIKYNADILENESSIEKIDSDNWRLMEEELDLEIIARNNYEIYVSNDLDSVTIKKKVRNLDKNCIDTQTECRRVIAELDGMSRYIDSANFKEHDELMNQVDKMRETLINLLHELWQKEEGHLYEQIGDGVYVKKKGC